MDLCQQALKSGLSEIYGRVKNLSADGVQAYLCFFRE